MIRKSTRSCKLFEQMNKFLAEVRELDARWPFRQRHRMLAIGR